MHPHVSWTVWLATLGMLVAVVALDLAVIARRHETVTVRVAVRWVTGYVGLAVLFATALLLTLGPAPSGQFLAGYVTEYSLSADNLFVFMIIMARFAVPAVALDRVLYVGIALSLVLRGMIIAAGSAAVNAFSWVFYLFGAFLIYTALRLLFERDGGEVLTDPGSDPGSGKENIGLRALRRLLPTTVGYVGRQYLVRVDGRQRFTPLLLVTAAIALANLVFALDSIPAVFGLTHSGYIVFTANAFAMMGLRQLYFLISGLVQRIVFLGSGLAVILTFIGVKLVFEALHGSHIEAVGPLRVPHVGTGVSLAVIVTVLGLTALASLLRNRWRARRADRVLSVAQPRRGAGS